MLGDDAEAVRLEDYVPPAFLVDKTSLHFDLAGPTVRVRAEMLFRRNPIVTERRDSMRLDGVNLDLQSLKLDGKVVSDRAYRLDEGGLEIFNLPAAFRLETEVLIRPEENTRLEGLYRSGSVLCTQCEAEGFRRITFFPDRPDVLSTFTTTIVANGNTCPVLLSNGHLVQREDAGEGLVRVVWHDPFPKPCYLFALVAGALAVEEGTFVTRSGRRVALRIFLEPHNFGRGGHALSALKAAMRWDEEVFGLEYDLDLYMIVAVDAFNAGAMENKGLNIFNSKYVLADPETATDADYQGIEEVVAHEYFHNWTGNRVTCRDWFQLCLKEGLTVFRDQMFSTDRVAGSLKRIQDVRLLRDLQFSEDAGPLAHPVRPAQYREINNFYTVTVYEKGAEVVRMLHTLLGGDRFQRGLAAYFERYDGQAVTVEDFLHVMQDTAGVDLTRFSRWYFQAGTPRVRAAGRYDADKQAYSLTLSQDCPATPGQETKAPFHIPVAIGLLSPDGHEMPVASSRAGEAAQTSVVLSLYETTQEFLFDHIPEKPIPSLLRGFSAPVKLAYDYSDDELMFLMVHDRDAFNRWDAGQQLATRVILRGVDALRRGEVFIPEPLLLSAYRGVLRNSGDDRGLAAHMLTLPGEYFLAEQCEEVDIEGICTVRRLLQEALGRELGNLFEATWQACSAETAGVYGHSLQEVASRSLKNLCMEYLVAASPRNFAKHTLELFRQAENMTDRLALLTILAGSDVPECSAALEAFYRQAHANPLVLDKWFAVQATSRRPGAVRVVHELLAHPDFNLRNPNRVRAVLHAFARRNAGGFHSADGDGYALVADYVLKIDRLNPQLAASLAGAFGAWRRFDASRKDQMKLRLTDIANADGVSTDVREIVERCLRGQGE